MAAESGERHLLPPERAFVVQLSTAASLDGGRTVGRVEHVVSGRSTHFESLQQLLVFMQQHLPQARTADRTTAGIISAREEGS